MRKIFAGAAALSLLGATVLGGALAWTDSQKDYGQAKVGSLQWQLFYYPENNALLGPNGAEHEVGVGEIQNTGDFNLKLKTGAVLITNVVPGNDAVSCASSNFSGRVQGIGTEWDEVIPPGNQGGEFAVYIKLADAAPEACMGDVVTYAAQIQVETQPGS